MNAKNTRQIALHLYDAAPVCFMLLIDDTVFVEQYHYGSLHTSRPTTVNMILGEDTALFEYTRPGPKRPDLYAGQLEIDTVGLMEDHFCFVFDQCVGASASWPALKSQAKIPAP